MLRQREGQAWGFDLTIALSIFLMTLTLFYLYTLNNSSEESEIFGGFSSEGNIIAESLLAEGHPLDWNQTNVQRIGITDKGEINQTKLERFYSLTTSDYSKTQTLFGIVNDYFINFSVPLTINGSAVNGTGRAFNNPENLIQVTRITIYRGVPVSMNVYVWD